MKKEQVDPVIWAFCSDKNKKWESEFSLLIVEREALHSEPELGHGVGNGTRKSKMPHSPANLHPRLLNKSVGLPIPAVLLSPCVYWKGGAGRVLRALLAGDMIKLATALLPPRHAFKWAPPSAGAPAGDPAEHGRRHTTPCRCLPRHQDHSQECCWSLSRMHGKCHPREKAEVCQAYQTHQNLQKTCR